MPKHQVTMNIRVGRQQIGTGFLRHPVVREIAALAPADNGVVHAIAGFVRVVGELHDNVRRCAALAFEITAVYPLGEQGADLTEQQQMENHCRKLVG